jgi:hypothetical protein
MDFNVDVKNNSSQNLGKNVPDEFLFSAYLIIDQSEIICYGSY